MPRLSVLMPARNAEATIGRAVRSTLRTLPRDGELVVLDDGSDDGTLDVLDRVRDPRLRVWSRHNRGVANTLNELLWRTDSDFVARMDADDVVLPGRFTRQLHALRRADMVFTTVVTHRMGGVPIPAAPAAISSLSFPYHLLLTNPVAHSTMAARRAVFSAGRYYRAVPSEDYDLWLRLAGTGIRIRRLALPGLTYRVHPGQVTATPGWRIASWRHPLIGEAYAELATRLLGAPEMRVSALAVADMSRDEKLARFAAFEQRFRWAIGPLPLAERSALQRRLHERSRWLLSQVADLPQALTEATQ